MAEHATVVRIAKLSPVPGRESEAEEMARRQAREISQEPGCFGAQACRSAGAEPALAVISRWESESSADDFNRSGRMDKIREESRGIFSGPPQLEVYTSLQP